MGFFRIFIVVLCIFFVSCDDVVLFVDCKEVDSVGLIYVFDVLVGEEDVVGVVGSIECYVFFGLVFVVEW